MSRPEAVTELDGAARSEKGRARTEPLDLTTRLSLRPKEAAAALGISERKLREVLPQLPHLRVGGAVLLPVDALQAWLREQAKVEQGRVERVVGEVVASVTSSGND